MNNDSVTLLHAVNKYKKKYLVCTELHCLQCYLPLHILCDFTIRNSQYVYNLYIATLRLHPLQSSAHQQNDKADKRSWLSIRHDDRAVASGQGGAQKQFKHTY